MVGEATRYSSKCTRTHQVFRTKRPHYHHRKLTGEQTLHHDGYVNRRFLIEEGNYYS